MIFFAKREISLLYLIHFSKLHSYKTLLVYFQFIKILLITIMIHSAESKEIDTSSTRNDELSGDESNDQDKRLVSKNELYRVSSHSYKVDNFSTSYKSS